MHSKNINDRFLEVRKLLNLSQRAFADKLEITQASVSRIEKNQQPLTDSVTSKLISSYNVSHLWLLNGSGPIFTITDDNFDSLFSYLRSQYVLSPAEVQFLVRFLSMSSHTRLQFLDMLNLLVGKRE